MKLTSLLPALMSLRVFLESGVTYAQMLQANGQAVNADVVGLFLVGKMQKWNPSISGVPVMDDSTRHAAARFLSGVATNLVGAANAATRRSA